MNSIPDFYESAWSLTVKLQESSSLPSTVHMKDP
jgi:hypothetical protein